MSKLTIARPVIKPDIEISNKPDRPEKMCICQMEVPGVGRLRTGERHPNFHLDVRLENIKTEKNNKAGLNEPVNKI